MSNVIEDVVNWLVSIASNSAYGYDQRYRWGERGDYDCSSLVITAWEKFGVGVKSAGATYTGNMYNVFTRRGFKDVTMSCNLRTGEGLKKGDILLNHVHHVATYIGGGRLVQASINEKGKATGGQAGDQKQKWGLKGEINVSPYYNYPWNCVLRYPLKASSVSNQTDAKIILETDGWFGYNTARRTQQFFGTIMDGVISGQPLSNKKYWYCTSQDRAFEWVADEYAEGSDVALALQNFLKKKGYYKGELDRWLGGQSVEALQRFLKDEGYYTGEIDRSAGNCTCKAWQEYLNKH